MSDSEFTKWLRDLWLSSLQATSNVKYANHTFDLKDFIQYSPTFIETGSCKGDGIKRALDAGFEKIISIELDPDLFYYCQDRFVEDKRVYLHYGNSIEVLPRVLQTKSVIFLDAHPAGPNTYGHDQLMNGDLSVGQDSVLRKELDVILSHRPDHLIFIDDQNGANPENDFYKEMMLLANPDYSFTFFDQVLGGVLHKQKVLGCLPVPLG